MKTFTPSDLIYCTRVYYRDSSHASDHKLVPIEAVSMRGIAVSGLSDLQRLLPGYNGTYTQPTIFPCRTALFQVITADAGEFTAKLVYGGVSVSPLWLTMFPTDQLVIRCSQYWCWRSCGNAQEPDNVLQLVQRAETAVDTAVRKLAPLGERLRTHGIWSGWQTQLSQRFNRGLRMQSRAQQEKNRNGG